MFSLLSRFFRKLERRYEQSVAFKQPNLWEEIRPPAWERFMRWFFGAPFTGEGSPDAVFWKWVQRIALVALYFFFLWILYESFWAWGIFD
ncbi:MAG: hypothetical protein IKM45_00585 [Opitutales bacterium]|nr:hypothetical protein [Opitutales bacterium]